MPINLKAPFFLRNSLLPLLEKATSHKVPARVTNIKTLDGLPVNVLPTLSYSPSKAGNQDLTHTPAARLPRRQIGVNAIAPPGRF